jgi:hypothetical protein
MTYVPLFVLGFAVALFGWGVLVIASRIEHDRRRRHADKFGDERSVYGPLPAWAQYLRPWLIPHSVKRLPRRSLGARVLRQRY